jgi:flagellar secretion chaperone FliS
MYPPRTFGADSYARVSLETSVMSADPHKLIALLFQGARQAIRMSRVHMQSGNVAQKGKLVSHAIVIIGGLQQGLNKEQGGDLAQRLDGLYEYMKRRLLEANLHNNAALLDEVDELLATIEDGWTGIQPQAPGARAPTIVAA